MTSDSNPYGSTQVIFTVFAGRKEYMEILMRYVDILVSRGHVHEVHLWDFTREASDTEYLATHPWKPYVQVHRPQKKKSWLEYYRYYTPEKYPDHVIIKSDDDIVFIDVDAFPGFIQRRLETQDTALVGLANIINNGVCAHLQQQHGFIDQTFGEMPYDTFCGRLWSDGGLACRLHQYFVTNKESWLAKARALAGQLWFQPVGDRISINFFAVPSSQLARVYGNVGWDDELDISVSLPVSQGVPNYVDLGLVVVHWRFGGQLSSWPRDSLCCSRVGF